MEKLGIIEDDQKDIPLKQKIKQLSLEWILSSTSHGLPSIFRTDQIYLKIIWSICLLASSGACAYIVVTYLISYFQYGVTVSTTIVTETPINFPAVTFCNLNPFYKKRADSFINQTLEMANVSYLLTLTPATKKDKAIYLSQVAMSYLKIGAASNPLINSTYRKTLGFYIDDMLISCSYGGATCTSDDFYFFQSYDYGNCYTFNSGKYANGSSSTIKSTSTSGVSSGLEVELFSGDSNDELFIYKRGFYVVVHNQSYSPIMDNEGVHASVGTQTNIGIDRSFYYKKSSPYSNCIEDTTSTSSSDSTLYQAILEELKEANYRQKYCYKLCYQHMVIQSCSCYDAAYASPFPSFGGNKISACHSSTEITCKDSTKSTFEQNPIGTQCSDDCPEECVKVMYSTSINTATYPTDYYLNWLLLETTLTNKFANQTSLSSKIQNSLAKINVFYNDISYTELSESASITWDTLLGNIGGQLGLFIGISVLSVVEIFEILFEIIRTIYLHRATAKVNQTV